MLPAVFHHVQAAWRAVKTGDHDRAWFFAGGHHGGFGAQCTAVPCAGNHLGFGVGAQGGLDAVLGHGLVPGGGDFDHFDVFTFGVQAVQKTFFAFLTSGLAEVTGDVNHGVAVFHLVSGPITLHHGGLDVVGSHVRSDGGASDAGVHRNDGNAGGHGFGDGRCDACAVHGCDGNRIDFAGDHVFDDRQLFGELAFFSGQLDEFDAGLLTCGFGAAIDQRPAFVGVAVGDVSHSDFFGCGGGSRCRLLFFAAGDQHSHGGGSKGQAAE